LPQQWPSKNGFVDSGWRQFFCTELGEFIDVLPPQQRIDEHWYQGTADAVYQNIYALEKERPEHVLILAGDHIYKMDYSAMVDYHKKMNADLTIAALPVDPESAKSFGVMEVNEQNRLNGFREKPDNPKTIPGDPSSCLASMGIYVFTARFLFEQLLKDANTPDSSHDFGKNIIPSIIDEHRVYAFPFRDENRKTTAYWRDVGTIEAYYEANMDLIQVDPMLNMYDQNWPIRTHQGGFPPPKFVFGSAAEKERVGMATDSIVCAGSIISGGRVEHCVLGPQVRVNSFAQVTDSILFDRVEVGRHAVVKRAIIDKNVKIPEGAVIGVDHRLDRARGFTVTESGIVVIGKSDIVEAGLPKSHCSFGKNKVTNKSHQS